MQLVSDENGAIAMTTYGGKVVQWISKGHGLLLPGQPIVVNSGIKHRGDLFVCYPNFGPAPPGVNLPQHGFLRKTLLDVVALDQVRMLQAVYTQEKDDNPKYPYRHKVVITAKLLEKGSFEHRVRITNTETNQGAKPMPVGFGIHPYFRLAKNIPALVKIGNHKIIVDGSSIGPLILPATDKVSLRIHNLGTIDMHLSGAYLNENARIIIWSDGGRTDSGDGYVCIERTVNNPMSFGDPKEGTFIEPGKSLEGSCIFELYDEI